MGINQPSAIARTQIILPRGSTESSSNILSSVHGRVVRQVRRADIARIPRILGGSRIILSNQSRVHGLGDLQREPTRQTLGGTLHGVLAFVGWQSLLVLHTEMKSAVAAASAHCLLGGNGAVDTDLTGADAGFRVGEDEALERC